MAKCNKAPKAITFGSRIWHTIKLLVLGLIEVTALVLALDPVLNTNKGIVEDVINNFVQVGGCALVHILFVFLFARCRMKWNLREQALANYVPKEAVVEEAVVEEVVVEEEKTAAPKVIIHEYNPDEDIEALITSIVN